MPRAANPHVTALLARIADRSATVGVIGQGYVGLPLALVFVEAGFTVIGFDVDPAKVEALDRGESYIRHIGPERVAAAREWPPSRVDPGSLSAGRASRPPPTSPAWPRATPSSSACPRRWAGTASPT